jgi:hypothetical protein
VEIIRQQVDVRERVLQLLSGSQPTIDRGREETGHADDILPARPDWPHRSDDVNQTLGSPG